MKKRLFLLMLTLVSMCPTIYGADHEGVPFESNITLPLKGERIRDHDWLNHRYPMQLGLVSLLATGILLNAIDDYIPSLIQQVLPRSLSTSRYKRSITWAIKLAPVAAVCCATICLWRYFLPTSNNIIEQYNERLAAVVTAHRRAVGNDHNGMITLDGNGRRVLRMRRHDLGLYETDPYPFDEWREYREEITREATSGLVNKLLLGPFNLQRIRVINEKLNALDSQLRVPQNVKGARSS